MLVHFTGGGPLHSQDLEIPGTDNDDIEVFMEPDLIQVYGPEHDNQVVVSCRRGHYRRIGTHTDNGAAIFTWRGVS